MKNSMKALISLSIAISVLIIILISCTKEEFIVEEPTQNYVRKIELKEVNFIGSWKGEGKKEAVIKDFIREYSFLNQDVAINYKFPEEIGYNFKNRAVLQTFLGEIINDPNPEWDIVFIGDNMKGTAEALNDPYWARDNFVDFSKIPGFAGTLAPEINLEKEKQRWNGIIPGPFLDGDYWALWSNKNVAKKLGIEIKQFGMTIDDFLSYIKAADDYNKLGVDYITPFSESYNWMTYFTLGVNLFMSEVGSKSELLNYELTENKLKAWHKTLKAFEEVSKYNLFDDNWRHLTWDDTKYNLLDENCLFFSNGSWMYNIWLARDASKVMNCVPNEFPVFEKESPLYPSSFSIQWGVLKNAPNKNEAVKLLMSLSKPTVAEDWVRNTKCPTGIKGSLANASFTSDQYERFLNNVRTKYGSNTYKMMYDSGIIFGKENAGVNNYLREVMMKQITADEAMEKIYESLAS